ncbi:MAG: UbiD family decarboxylase [Candidatus Eremiobacteraeota bacterium]|nr:UbiD family decarboxylase [Candidatus Eremiobacteraeota bacterium]
MERYRELLDKAKTIQDPLKRTLFFLGLMSEALGSEKERPVVVGGFALEFYSTGGYATGDVDLVYADPGSLGVLLNGWGFRKEGRHWISEELDLFIEIPGFALAGEERDRVTIVEVEGLQVALIGIEDLIVDRLNAFVHWKSTDDGYWAEELLFMYGDNIDRAYLERRCVEEHTAAALGELCGEVARLKHENP